MNKTTVTIYTCEYCSLADYAYSYRIGNQVLGMPIETFKNLMHKAANLVLANT